MHAAHARDGDTDYIKETRAALEAALREALDLGEPAVEVKCWEEPQYERPPRQYYELTKLAAFEALPAGTHKLYLAPKAKP